MQQQTASACCVDSVAKHSHAHSTAPVQHSSSTAHSKPARGKRLNCGALQLRDRAVALLQYFISSHTDSRLHKYSRILHCIIQPYFALLICRAVDASAVRRVDDRARAPRGAGAPWLTGCSPTLAQLGRS